VCGICLDIGEGANVSLSVDEASNCKSFQLTGYATESNEKKYICCFMRATHAINNIYKLISFLNLYLLFFFIKITKRLKLHDSDP